MGFRDYSFYGKDMDHDGDIDRDDDILYEMEQDEYDRINGFGIYEKSSLTIEEEFEDEDEEEIDELEEEGLDIDELSMMDEDERREAIEAAGLDPDDFEHLF